MKFTELAIKGAFKIQGEPFADHRGSFRRNFCKEEFSSLGLDSNIMQANISVNNFKYTLRGFHYQKSPFGEAKTMTCYSGKIFDVIIDLRKDSETYLKHISFEVDSKNLEGFHVPAGCANAFFTLEDNTIVHYYCSNPYTPSHENGIRYNDPLFSVDWPRKPEVISEKDLSWRDFSV